MKGFFGRLFFILKGGEPWLDECEYKDVEDKPTGDKLYVDYFSNDFID